MRVYANPFDMSNKPFVHPLYVVVFFIYTGISFLRGTFYVLTWGMCTVFNDIRYYK